jgi:hypothetical protein
VGGVESICLVSCVGAKGPAPAPAKYLYRSHWFANARSYAEAVASRWYILSARHGLIQPDEVIAPYNVTLNTMGTTERRCWARHVQKQMDAQMPDARRIVVLAGQHYREYLMDYLNHRAPLVEVPMSGLRIGEQLSWLGRHAGNGPVQ